MAYQIRRLVAYQIRSCLPNKEVGVGVVGILFRKIKKFVSRATVAQGTGYWTYSPTGK